MFKMKCVVQFAFDQTINHYYNLGHLIKVEGCDSEQPCTKGIKEREWNV